MGLLVRIDSDRQHLPVPSVVVEADSWRTIFSRGDATLLSGHARTSLAATGDNFHEGQNHPTKAAWVSPKPPRTILHGPHERKARPVSFPLKSRSGCETAELATKEHQDESA